ncbi:porin [Thalassovita aquimarina]|uniref:Porin n=1 Tax=Thalassovita aquimarina TaxID=2785917 RepID=A0ABS5HNT6_9RHOB|nr:porin [Thalassovita aquimarina]MBR9650579.1 porin [Thalassovita aquimarina]
MKNFILATTALVATAGVAAADVSISGYGRFGVSYSDNADDWTTASRLRLQFDMSTETDGGITFGARQRFQTEENAANAGGNGARFYMTTGGFTLAMGNILGVVEAAPNLYMPTKSAGVGLEGNGFHSLATNTSSNAALGDPNAYFGWTAYSSAGAGATDGVEVLYSMGGLGLHAHSTDTSYGIGANYEFSGYTVAAAYEEFDNDDTVLFASVGGKLGAANVALAYGETEFDGVSASKWSLKGAYDVSTALNVYGFVASEDNGANESYGLGASYDLGGGVSLEGGITQTDDNSDDTVVSMGAFFSF